MATVKDRAKIRAALSIVALSVTMGIDSSIFTVKYSSLIGNNGN